MLDGMTLIFWLPKKRDGGPSTPLMLDGMTLIFWLHKDSASEEGWRSFHTTPENNENVCLSYRRSYRYLVCKGLSMN